MKTILNLSLVVLLLSYAACKKKSLENGIDGTWELRHVSGGMIRNANPNYKKGNGYIYKFNGGNFERYSSGKLIESGTFSLTTESKSINNTTANGAIVFSSSKEKVYINLNKDKLILFFGIIAADGIESTYERQ